MDILDIFYNHIIKEAQKGRIDCFMYYNIVFKTAILEDNIFLDTIVSRNDILIPTLIIKDKKKFNELLIKYVNLALDFYDDNSFIEEIINKEEYDSKAICKEKAIISFLFANATVEDFNDPISYLNKRIDFLLDDRLEKFSNEELIGYSEILDSNIFVKVERDLNGNEAPYKLIIKLMDKEKNESYILPAIKLGLSHNDCYIYAIQTEKGIKNDTSYGKKINRLIYKIGENFDLKNDNFENYDIGNLKDVTPSFVVASCITLSLIEKLNIDNIVIPSILVERWNSKKISLEYLPNKIIDKDSYINEKNILQDKIQTNLTDKFIRTFMRLAYHFQNINVTSMPYELDSNFHLNLEHDNVICNNLLLEELYNIGYEYNKNIKSY